jgi:RNA polymerase sigma-B factor
MAEAMDMHHDPEALVARYLEDPRPDLKDLIMVEYAALVERVARKFCGLEPYEDLVQVGFIGLLNALTKYDPEAGVRFNTYATYLVAGEIKHYLRDRSQTIRHPAWLQELRHKVNRASAVLQQTLGRSPLPREIADHLNVSESSIEDVFETQDMIRVASLDSSPQTDDDGDPDVERLDASDFCPEQLSVEDRVLLEDAMRQLRDLERQVLVHFHFDAMNQTEIAAKLGISCNYVSHILRQSLAKLRKILATEERKDNVLRRQSATISYDVIDDMTGAYTESYFNARLQEELHRASSDKGVVSVVKIDFKGLPNLQSFYGEGSVIDFMADAAEFFRGQVRRLDIVCRIGESGFGIILPATGAGVSVVRQRLVQRVKNWISVRNGMNGPITVEIGHAAYPEDGTTMKTILQRSAPKPLPAEAAKDGGVELAA